VYLTRSDSFAAPNPNDDIPTLPANIGQGPDAQLPKASIPIHVPHGEALDVPDAQQPAPHMPEGGAEEGEGSLDAMGRPIPTEELFVKDAFLVFRALCKLSMKALVTETYVPLCQFRS
jgi:brefeldin A-inhibited guanine nucleotide-exchange protein